MLQLHGYEPLAGLQQEEVLPTMLLLPGRVLRAVIFRALAEIRPLTGDLETRQKSIFARKYW